MAILQRGLGATAISGLAEIRNDGAKRGSSLPAGQDSQSRLRHAGRGGLPRELGSHAEIIGHFRFAAVRVFLILLLSGWRRNCQIRASRRRERRRASTIFLGSQFYRFWIRAHEPERTPYAWYLAGFFALLPLAAADYRIGGTGEQVAYEEQFGDTVVRRDSTATVVALGDGMGMRLLINGIGTTHLTPITKMMAHLPMACLTEPPRNSLVICFGMGTSFRSLHSWGVPVTAV